MCIATGSKTVGGTKVTANIPLSDITPVVPTKLSDLTDDITVDTYDSTSEAPISGKGVASALANFGGFIVTTIENGKPKVEGTPDPKKIYLTPTGESGTENAYDEWICTDATVPTWEKVGVTRVDLSQYYTKTEADSAFVSKTGYVATENNYTTTEKTKLGSIETGAEVNKIERISIGYTEIEPDVNKNVNIGFSGSWLTTDENNNIYVSPSYGGGTGGLNCDSDYDLSVAVDKSTIGIYHTEGGTLHVICDNDTIVENGNGLEVAYPVPDTDNASNGDVLTYDGATDEIVWAAPASGLPDPTGVTDGYVLTVNNGAASWAAPGGGGSSPLIIPITGGLDFADDIQISSYITIPSGESALATFIEYCKNHLDTMFKLNYGTDIILFRLWSIDIDSSEMMSKVHFVGSNCGYTSVIYDLTVQYSEGDDVGWIAVTIYNDHFYSNP